MMSETITHCPGEVLTLEAVRKILFEGNEFTLSAATLQKVENCYTFLKEFAADKVIYGINTGFGPMAQYRINDESLLNLQYNIVKSHSTGAGNPLPPIYVKSAMIARTMTFAQGYSGVHTDLVNLLIAFINRNICPVIPEHGGVGASGDLVQLAHMALALIGEGEVFYQGKRCDTNKVLKECGLSPFHMRLREGLAATNGTSVMTGIGLVNIIHARQLLKWSLIASALMNEIAGSYDDCFSDILNGIKRHEGQQQVAAIIRNILQDSQSIRKREIELYCSSEEKIFTHKIQPYYSLRCVPQILGPVLEQMQQTEKVLVNELNSVCDNPVVDPESRNVYHGGNFHGDYISFEMDKLKIAVTKLTMLAERQLNYLCHDRINDILPPFVNLGVLGLNYGMQAAQFTATSTTAENQTLSNPMYIHSIPNNNDNQDIVSMGTNSALLTKTVIENGFQVMAIHFMTLVQAVDCLQIKDRLSSYTQAIYEEIRTFFPIFADDTPKYKEIEQMMTYLKNKKITTLQ